MWKKIRKITDLVLVVGFLVFIYYVSARTTHTSLSRAVEDLKVIRSQNLSYKDLSRKIKELRNFPRYAQSSIYRKNDFINLNGLVARCLGMNSLNRIQKLRNGFLTGFSGAINPQRIEESAKEVVALNNFLAERGIPFLYVLAPSKNVLYDTPFAPGYGDDSKQNLTNMINALNSAGVETINMDAWFKENGWHYEDVFFKTDHHWIPEAGLAAAKCIMALLQKNGNAKYDEEKFREESYKKDILKNWFLGSSGKRTGQYYGGVDDITVFYPNFETQFLFSRLMEGTTRWEFSSSPLDLALTRKRDFFNSDPRRIYLGWEHPVKIISNPLARNKKRVLSLGDSFFQSCLYFLSTQFQEIQAIDLRHYKDGTFTQYIEEFNPDIVIICLNSVTGIFYNYGLESYLASLEKTDPTSPVQNLGNFELCAEKNNNDKFTGVYGCLEPNQAYTLTVDRTALSGVEHSFVQMTLQNLSTNKAIFNRYFESNSEARQKWIFTTPEKTEDAYGIYLYAGTKGHTAGIDVKVEGVRLRKGIFED